MLTSTLEEFDKVIWQEFENDRQIKEEEKNKKVKISGTRRNFNYVENIWQFVLEEPKITTPGNVLESQMIKVVLLDAELNPYVDKKEEDKGNSRHNSRKRKRK